MDDQAFQQPVAHQIHQWLQILAALNYPARQDLTRNLDTVSAQHRIETVQRQAIDLLGRQQHRQNTRTGHALFDQLSGFVGGDRNGFTNTATVNSTDVFDHTDLHRHDIQLLAGFFTDHMFEATAGTGQLMFGQLVDHFDARQVSRHWLALTATRCWRGHFFVVIDLRYRQAFRLIEQRKLRRVGLNGLLGSATEQTVAQQLDLLYEIDNLTLIDRALNQ